MRSYDVHSKSNLSEIELSVENFGNEKVTIVGGYEYFDFTLENENGDLISTGVKVLKEHQHTFEPGDIIIYKVGDFQERVKDGSYVLTCRLFFTILEENERVELELSHNIRMR